MAVHRPYDDTVASDSLPDLPTALPSIDNESLETMIPLTEYYSEERSDHESDDEDGDKIIMAARPNQNLKRVEAQNITHKARQYQQELFERAKKENIIAVLDTGSGKTLVAALLIRHTLQQELIDRAQQKMPRMIFFLVNSVHLVHQQADFLKANLSDSPEALYGDTNVDLWKRAEWEQILLHQKIVVCTAAILDQCLWHRYLHIGQISLIVMDEAHHCKKNHPYSRIIRDYYVKYHGDRPKIFSMTASPVDSKRDIRLAATELEELLHSKIVTTKDASIFEFAPRPNNELWRYNQLTHGPETDLCSQLRPLCGFVRDLNRYFIYAKTARAELGDWFADRVWKHIFGSTDQQVATITRKYETSKDYLALPSMEVKTARIRALEQAAALVQRYRLPRPGNASSKVSPKLARLQREIERRYSADPHARSIVFVQQQMSVMLLKEWFNAAQIPHVNAGMLVGVTQSWIDESSRDRQERQMDSFRNGTTNLMFATSVAEEGIDIPQCNLVVRFDICTSPIQYIQSRGRARMKDSTFAQLIEEGNFDQEAKINYAADMEQYIKLYCSNLPIDRLLGRGTNLRKMMIRDAAGGSFVTEAGTTCNLFNSLTILSRYVSTLRYLGATGNEIYEEIPASEGSGDYRFLVRLPTTTESPVKGALGIVKQNKILAKRSAAFRCITRLRNEGLLDKELNSVFAKIKPENANARLAVSEKKDRYDMKTKPDFWNHGIGGVPPDLFACIINLTPQRALRRCLTSLVMFTRDLLPPIPSFPVFIEEGVKVLVSFTQTIEKVPVTGEEVELLTAFTLDGVFADVFAKVYVLDSNQVSYWLAVAAPEARQNSNQFHQLVDMQVLSQATTERVAWTPEMPTDIWQDQFLIDPLNGRDHFFSGMIVQGASIHDPVPADMPKVAQRSRDSIIDFSDSHWKASRKKQADRYDPAQPVLNAELIMTRRNFLDPSSVKDNASIFCRIAPQPLLVARINSRTAATCLIWPSIIHRLESYLISMEAFTKIGMTGIPHDLALEACTKGAGGGDEEQLHTDNRGMGKNYERLEFIGDSLLKMMTTITVFNRTNCDEEGMHCKRMEILCNRRLFEVSTTQHELYQYVRTSPFNRSTWYPQFLQQKQGRQIKHDPEKHDLGMKTIADVSEAMIGAAVLASREAPAGQKFDRGIQSITRLVASEDHAIESWAEVPQMYSVPTWQLVMDDPIASDLAEKMAVKIGYRFNYPRLARSALTHASEATSVVPDLQRLEFLGDACLDWVCIDWLFRTNPDRNPQWLTEHKMAMVSNKFLAALAVTLDLDKLILTPSTTLLGDIASYARKIRTAYPEAQKTGNRAFWTNIQSPPKALSDLVESTIGAVLIDSGFNYSEIENFFNRHVLWFFENISDYDSFANRQPTTYAFKRLSQEYGCMKFHIKITENVIAALPQVHTDIETADDTTATQIQSPTTKTLPPLPTNLENESMHEADGQTEFTASFTIHDQVMTSSKGISPKYAKLRASRMALKVLEQLSIQEFRETFDCDCRRVDFNDAEIGTEKIDGMDGMDVGLA